MGNAVWRAFSVVGFLLLVSAYLLNQRGILTADSRRYLGMNTVGAALLAVYSWWIGEWIFVALEGFWAIASLWAVLSLKTDGTVAKTDGTVADR